MRTISAGTILDISSSITARQSIVVKPTTPIVVNLPDGRQSRIESIRFSYLHNGDRKRGWAWNHWLTRVTFDDGEVKSLTGANLRSEDLRHLADSARPTTTPALV